MPRCISSATRKNRSRRSRRTPRAPGTLEEAPHINRATLKAKGLRRRGASSASRRRFRAPSSCRSSSTSSCSAKSSAKTKLGLTDEQLNDWNFSILRDGLGFSDAADRGGVGAHLRPHDGRGRAVPQGRAPRRLRLRDAVRQVRLALHPAARARRHDGGRAAVGLSGAISKTINLPQTATIADVKEAYRYSWERMIKAVALYRDGSKLSQPLAASYDFGGDAGDEEARSRRTPQPFTTAAADRGEDRLPLHRQAPPDAAAPQRLHAEGDDLRPQGLPAHRRVRGRPARRDLHRHAQGRRGLPLVDEQLRDRDLARACSTACRSRSSSKRSRSRASSPTARSIGHDHIKMATSILDYIFRELAVSYLGRYDLAHVQPSMQMDAMGPEAQEEYVAEEEGGVQRSACRRRGEAPSGEHASPSRARDATVAADGERCCRIRAVSPAGVARRQRNGDGDAGAHRKRSTRRRPRATPATRAPSAASSRWSATAPARNAIRAERRQAVAEPRRHRKNQKSRCIFVGSGAKLSRIPQGFLNACAR